MMEYPIIVTAKVTKKYVIEADSGEEAITNALEFFNDFITEESEDEDCINEISITIEESEE